MHGRMPPHGEWACVERARNDSNGTDASRKTRKPTRGSDGGWLAGAVENQGNSNETHPEKTKLKNDGCPWWRAWKCHSRKLLSDRQTLHLRIAGFGGDGAMPVARCHRRRSMSCCRPSESPGGRERRMLPAALAICAAEFNKFCPSLRARPVTRSCPAPQVRKMARKATEGRIGYAVLHAARLL